MLLLRTYHQNLKSKMKFSKIILKVSLVIVFNLFLSNILFAQKTEEDFFKAIDTTAFNLEETAIFSAKPSSKILQKFTQLAELPQEMQLLAVVNARIGKALQDKGYFESAIKFHKKSYHYRKEIGKYLPIRWALKTLYKNSLHQKKIKQAQKYAKEWLIQFEKYYQKDSSWIKIYPDYILKSTPRLEMGYIEYLDMMKEVAGLAVPLWMQENVEESTLPQRFEIGEKMLLYFMSNYKKCLPLPFSQYRSSEIPLYGEIITYYIGKNDIVKAKYWEQKAIKIVAKYRQPKEYLAHLRYLASLYKEGSSFLGLRTNKYESEGIRLMNFYATIAEKQKLITELSFAHRYKGLRYLHIKSYSESIQSFVEAIKIAYKYNQKDSIPKAYFGIQKVLTEIVKEQDSSAWKKCLQTSKDLKGLPIVEDRKIDSLIATLNFNEYWAIENEGFLDIASIAETKSEGKYIRNSQNKWVRDGKWLKWGSEGFLAKQLPFVQGKLDGEAFEFYKDKSIQSKLTFKDDLKEGKAEMYYPDGKVKMVLNFISNILQDGIQYIYYKDGKIKTESFFTKKDEPIKIVYYDQEGKKVKTETWLNEKLTNTETH